MTLGTLLLILSTIVLSVELYKTKRDWEQALKQRESWKTAYDKLEKDFIKVCGIAKNNEARANDYRKIVEQAVAAAFKEEIDKYQPEIDKLKEE